MSESTFLLVGNPNVGKSTLFNELTGLRQATGNYPGVTVEKRSGIIKGTSIELIDLPGCYSLSAYSPDEMIVSQVLMGHMPDIKATGAVVAIDITNLKRNLYFLSQLRSLNLPIVVALNMMDIAEAKGVQVNVESLSQRLGCPVIPVSGYKGKGINELKQAILNVKMHPQVSPIPLTMPEELQNKVDQFKTQMQSQFPQSKPLTEMEALRVIVDEGGYAQEQMIETYGQNVMPILTECRGINEKPLVTIEAKTRRVWAAEIASDTLSHPLDISQKSIDRFLCHPILGLIFFAALMTFIFQSIYTWAGPFMDLIDAGTASLGEWIGGQIQSDILRGLIVDGAITGVGSVVIFLPQILILTFAMALLEDSGYMARAAFLMDRLLKCFGLSGHAFIPMLSSHACAIPGIMATRTIRDARERLATMLVAPLMSCSARLPVYLLMIAAFVPSDPILGGWMTWQGLSLTLMYFVGPIFAIPVALIARRWLFKNHSSTFLMELPNYKLPKMKSVVLKLYEQGKEFLQKAGTVIFAVSVVVWALSFFPRTDLSEDQKTLPEDQQSALQFEQSFLGQAGKVVAPVVAPMGWDWRIGVCAIASFPAREVIVATLGIVFQLGSDVDEESPSLRQNLQDAKREDGSPLFTIPVAFSIMIFFALCCQCGATLAMMKRETGSWLWPAATFVYMTTLAYIASTLVYQIGRQL